jgi:hypothetical protein
MKLDSPCEKEKRRADIGHVGSYTTTDDVESIIISGPWGQANRGLRIC